MNREFFNWLLFYYEVEDVVYNHNIYYLNMTTLEYEAKEKTDSMINEINFSKLPSPSDVNYK